MRQLRKSALLFLFILAGCGSVKLNKTALKMMVAATNRLTTELFYADSCEHRTAVPYVENGTGRQVVDIYYASEKRKDAVLIDIHGGFYVGGDRRNNRCFASVFLKEGYDVVLLEYRLCDGKVDVQTELEDCAAALDFLTVHAGELGLNRDRMFLTGDSAGGHLALYMAEAGEDRTMPIHPEAFVAKGALLNCPAYDFASFGSTDAFTEGALELFIGPRWKDKEWMEAMSPRTFIGRYTGPLFVSTCTKDFIREQSLFLQADCADRDQFTFVDISSEDKNVGHVHNVIHPSIPASQEVNAGMVAFMDAIIGD